MTTALMYHELERRGRPLAAREPGYVRYVVDEARFAQHVAWIANAGLRGVSLGYAHQTAFDGPSQVVMTFDDGCESDWTIAAPYLLERAFGATFYVVSRWIGRRAGFLSASQLHELSDAGFEIGSHTATHALLPDLDKASLRRELADSKREIEDIVGRAVAHLSCPGGRTNTNVAHAARDAGYETMATSRIGVNGPGSDRFALARCAVKRETPQHTFESFCRGDRLTSLQVREHALDAAKTLLGNRLYASLRHLALRSPTADSR